MIQRLSSIFVGDENDLHHECGEVEYNKLNLVLVERNSTVIYRVRSSGGVFRLCVSK